MAMSNFSITDLKPHTSVNRSRDDLTASIIIVTYNGRRYLEGCLSSVLAELWPGCELIVVDNASTDGSPAFIEETFPVINLVRNEFNLGFAPACSQAAILASGEVLVFLNQDTRVQPGWLAGLVRGLKNAENTGLTTSKILLMSQPDRIHLCGQNVHYTGLVFGRGFMSPAQALPDPTNVAAVAGAAFAIRRETWEKLGGFDGSFLMYYEETDLCWRAHLAGYRCLYVPDSIVYHDYTPGSRSYHRLYYSMRNRTLLNIKNWRMATLLLLSPALLLAELIEITQAFRCGKDGLHARLRAYLWLFTNLPRIRHSRRLAQQLRGVPDAEILTRFTHRLSPRELPSRPLQEPLLALLNAFFQLHYRSVLYLCRALGL